MSQLVRFTQAEDDLIIKLRDRNFGTPEIARRLNRKRSSVHGRMKLLEAGNAHCVGREIVPELGSSTDAAIRKATHKLWIAVAHAIANGDHLPAAQRLAA